MPRAGDDAGGDGSLSERTSGVGADAVEGVDVVAFAEESDDVLSGHDFKAGVGGDVVEVGDANPVHGEYPERVVWGKTDPQVVYHLGDERECVANRICRDSGRSLPFSSEGD